MDKKYIKQKKVSVIIPAFNEQETIKRIIEVAQNSIYVDEVIVVDDGSSDDTYKISKNANAKTIKLSQNHGKAFAMDAGIKASKNNVVVFLDADLIKLGENHIAKIVLPVLNEETDLNIAIRKRKNYLINKLLRIFPLIGGERCLKKELWESIPNKHKNKFEIEIAINYFAKKNNYRTKSFYMSGVHQIIKEKKHGFFLGSYERLKMIRDIIYISIKLYLIDKPLTHFKNSLKLIERKINQT